MSDRILAIDPGTRESGWLVYDPGAGQPVGFGIDPNDGLVAMLRERWATPRFDVVVIEQVRPYGMATGLDILETVRWAGRFEEAVYPTPVVLAPRKKVTAYICGNANAKDPNIRQALIDRFGGIDGKAAAIGRKACPGPLYGITSHVWAALAIAIAYAEGGLKKEAA